MGIEGGKRYTPEEFVTDLRPERKPNPIEISGHADERPELPGDDLSSPLPKGRAEDLYNDVAKAARETSPLVRDLWDSIVVAPVTSVTKAAVRRITRN